MSNPPFNAGYSANIRLWMELDGRIHALDQVADQWVIPTSAWDHPPAHAMIVMEIDGRRHERMVSLPQGVTSGDRFVPIRDEPAPATRQAAAG